MEITSAATTTDLYPHLQARLQKQSLVDVYTQYGRLIRTLGPYHEQHFPAYQDQYAQLVGHKPVIFQPSWNQFMDSVKLGNSVSSSIPTPLMPLSRTPSSTTPSMTRPYRARIVVPGFCNQERTGEQCMNIKVPKTPSAEYIRPNINKDDRYFTKTQQTIRIYEYTQAEWIELARKCVNNIKVMQMNFQPLTIYCQYVLKAKAANAQSQFQPGSQSQPQLGGQDGLTPPAIFSAKLTKVQKDELLDAFYWSEMKHNREYMGIINYYKLLGWFVRRKDGYRQTKHHMERQSVLKRNQLIANGTLQLKYELPKNGVKSARGRKRKQNVTL
jgi:hypothetical protein